ncbi:MAG TPA: protein kinase [Dongiaceae bacterium]|nr:protein kinase [Dongiaceae bacterium]
MPLAPGTKLGPYEIVSPLGAGGMGEVYRARDTRLDRSVAIKILPHHLSADASAKARFEREAKTVSALNHPNICSLFDVGSQDGTDFLVMECIEGESLAQRIAKGSLPTDQVVKIGAAIADALDKAHRSGVVHRDLKPGNIMLTKSGAKLLDFGLAKPSISAVSAVTITNVAASSPVTEQGTIVGTFQYMCPEQVEGKELDGRSDIFSLGAVLYEALTGQRAFEGRSQLSVASAILEKEPAPITTIKPLAPRSLDHIIRRCLAKDPDDRWQSARDLSLELNALATLDPSSSQSGVALPVTRRKNHRELVAWVLAALALVAAAALLFVMPNRSSPTAPLYSSIVSPVGTSFEIEGDLGKQPALSPDGMSLVFGAGGELYLHSLRTGTARVLTGAHGATSPFWSPDGSSIGFFADGKVKTLDITSGVVRIVCDAPAPRGGAWGPTGVILFTPTPRDSIFQVPANGGTPTRVTVIDDKIHSTHRWPVFLPDGQHFLYYAASHASAQSLQSGVYIASLDGKLNRFLVTSAAAGLYSNGNLLYAKESGLLAQPLDLHSYTLTGSPRPLVDSVVVDLGVWHMTVAAAANSPNLIYQTGSAMALTRLEWVDRAGAHLSYIGDKAVFFGPRLSKDGQRFLITFGDPSPDIWLFDSSGSNRTRLTFDGTITGEASWSPDNSHFTSILGLANSVFHVITRSASGSGQSATVPTPQGTNAVTDWSPDGRWVLTEQQTPTAYNVMAIPVDSGDQAHVVFSSASAPGPNSSGQFSPDGKYVALTVLLASGPEIFIVPFAGGTGMWQVSTDGGHWGRWSRDGNQLYYVNAKNEMNAVNIQEKSDGLVVGHPVPLFSFRPSPRVYRLGLINYDVSPDGKRFLLVTAADENNRPLTLLQNWPSLLEVGAR